MFMIKYPNWSNCYNCDGLVFSSNQQDFYQSPPEKKVSCVSCVEYEECPYDHNLYSTSYNEEADKRYLGKDGDLFGIKYEQYNKNSVRR